MYNSFLLIVAWARKTIACTAFCVTAQTPRVTGAPGLALSARLLRSLSQANATVRAKTMSTFAKPIPASNELSDE
jgi:hypothetical protein